MYRLSVTKLPTVYQRDERGRAQPASPEQLAAIRKITDVLCTIIARCLRRGGASNALSDGCPFHLFEMSAGIALIVGLDEGCWVMLELSGQSPTVIFEDRDLLRLRDKTAAELEEAASELHYQLNNPTSFVLLTRQ